MDLPTIVEHVILPSVTGITGWFGARTQWKERLTKLEAQVEGALKAWRGELDANRVLLQEELAKLRIDLVDLRKSVQEDADDNNEKWEAVQRAIGRVEGMISGGGHGGRRFPG